MSRPVRGVVGRIEWGYFAAAAINGYHLQQNPDGTWALRGTVVSCDAFKLRMKPLTFVAPHQFGEWRWPIQTLDVETGMGPRELRATLGAQLPEMITATR